MRRSRRIGPLLLAAVLVLSVAACSARRSSPTPSSTGVLPSAGPVVAPLDQMTCVELSRARIDLVTPSSPASVEAARAKLDAKAPSYVRQAIGDLAGAGGDKALLLEPNRAEANTTMQRWLNEACAPSTPPPARLDQTTCLDLSLARVELAAPSSPEAIAPARETLSAQAPQYLQVLIDALASAASDPTMADDPVTTAADDAVRHWMNLACRPGNA